MPELTTGTKLALLAALAAAATACRTVDTPGFCCNTPTDCSAHGAPQPVSCPSPLVCDSTRFTCIDPANGGHCDSMNDCSGVTPYCDLAMHECKQCMVTIGCTAAAPVCGADESCAACTGEPDCTSYTSTPHCATTGNDAGQCVQCRDGNDCAAATPVCDANACRACRVDDECPSHVCDDTSGMCVAGNDVIYMTPTGSGTACTMAQPCGTFSVALAQVTTSRHTIDMAAGSYTDQVSISGVTVDIHGAGADLTSSAAGPVVSITGVSDVSIEGIRIHGGHTMNTLIGHGVTCTAGSVTIKLRHVTVDMNSGLGVNAGACDVTVDRSQIVANNGGGILVNDAFTIENDFISGNGNPSSGAGGVVISNVMTAGTHVFQFNSVTNNVSSSVVASGVYCTIITVPLALGNSIVYGNVGGSGKQIDGGNCAWTYSDLGDTVAGTGNISVDPMFVNATQNDLHLKPTSLCKSAGDPASTVKVDIDGDPRSDGMPDIGADEITP
jgi:hypothetical protein